MVDVVVFIVVAVPGVFLVMWLRAKVFGEIDELGERLGHRAAIARRLPYHRALRGWGIICLPLALIALAEGFKGPDTTAHAWHVLLLIAVGFVGLSAILLGLWWISAGRQAEQTERDGGITALR
jgi:hypothetical protein